MRARSTKFSHHGAAQVLLYAAAYLLYLFGRGLAAGGSSLAFAHARDINHLEALLGLNIEASVQRPFLHSWLLWIFNNIYLSTQLLVVPLTLLALYYLARPFYSRLRNTLLISWLIALPLYALYPCAPPRLAQVGVVDTISSQTAVKLNSDVITSLYDRYAAMPSMHVGFAFAISVALFCALARYRYLRVLALLWGPLVALTVVVTGNHFILDEVAGVAVVALAWPLNRYVGAAAAKWRVRPSRRRA